MPPPDLHSWFDQQYLLLKVALGSALLGIVSGALGTYAVLRKQSLLGDAISHAALPGIVIAFLLVRSKMTLPLVIGAAAAGWVGTLVVMSIVRSTRIKYDTALGVVLAVFFGLGILLLKAIPAEANQAGLEKFIYGRAAEILESDIIIMAHLGAAALLVMLAFWKEFKLLCFDPEFGASLGFPMRRLDVLLTSLLVLAIVMGLETVGAVLMSAMLVAPAVAARQWTDRLGVMMALSALFGALAGICGAVLVPVIVRLLLGKLHGPLPTGPPIILCASVIVIVSLFLAPNRGLTWRWVRQLRNRRQLRIDAVLGDLYALALQHPGLEHGHSVAVLRAMSGHAGVERSLQELAARGWACQTAGQEWLLTPAGRAEAERLIETRTASAGGRQ